MNLIYFVLCSYGLTQILVYAKILDKLRPTRGFVKELMSCPMCVGFWVGVLLWALNDYTTLFTFDNYLVTGMLLGCLSSGASYVLNMLFGDDGVRLDHKGIKIRTRSLNRNNAVGVRR